MTPEDAIRGAFPGTDLLHHDVRTALLRLYHAGIITESFLENVAHYLEDTISDPPYSIWYGPERAQHLIWTLRNLANQIEAAASALNAAKPHWQRFNSPEEGTDVGVRPASGSQGKPDDDGEPCPF